MVKIKKSDRAQISVYDKNDWKIVFAFAVILIVLIALLTKDFFTIMISLFGFLPLIVLPILFNSITIDSDFIYVNKFFKKEKRYKTKDFKKIYTIIPILLFMIKFKNGDYFYFSIKSDDTWKKFIK